MSKLQRLGRKQELSRLAELTDADLQLVSGGADPNYKFCWNGPAGTGTYPNSVDCDTPTWGQIFQAWADLGKSFGGRPA